MKKAKLIKRTHLFRQDEYICSACGFTSQRQFSVCPRCGAGMRGGKTDPQWVDEMADYDMIFGEN